MSSLHGRMHSSCLRELVVALVLSAKVGRVARR